MRRIWITDKLQQDCLPEHCVVAAYDPSPEQLADVLLDSHRFVYRVRDADHEHRLIPMMLRFPVDPSQRQSVGAYDTPYECGDTVIVCGFVESQIEILTFHEIRGAE